MALTKVGAAFFGVVVGLSVGAFVEHHFESKPQLTVSHSVAQDPIDAWFSPKGGCTQEVVTEIDKATKTIHCQAYSFTSHPIADALLRARSRGVAIIVILDKSQKVEKGSELEPFVQAGLPTWIDAKHAIAHNKIFIIDGSTLLTGSFNFTGQAENSNAENLLVIRNNSKLVAEYEQNFQKHLSHSDKAD